MKKLLKIIYFAVCFILLFTVTSFAYLDPATMTYVIQIAAGIFIAGGAAVGIYWKKIKIFFRKQKAKKASKHNMED